MNETTTGNLPQRSTFQPTKYEYFSVLKVKEDL